MDVSNRCRARFAAISWLGAILLVGSFSRLAAQDISDAASGRQLAKSWCNTCHSVTPTPQSGVSTGAPTFSAIARTPATTPLSLRVFLQTPPSQMPGLHLSRDEIDNLAGYLPSLRHK